jgi:hypothetical protein
MVHRLFLLCESWLTGQCGGAVYGDSGVLHSGGLGGFDACFGVFEDEAIGWRDLEAGGSYEEGLGVRLAVGVVLGADHSVEATEHAERGEGALDGETRRTGDDGHGDLAVHEVDVRDDGGDGLYLVEHLEVELLFAVDDSGRVEVIAEALVEHFDGAREGDAAPGPEEVFGEIAAGFADGLLPGDEVQRHGVGDGAVEVEEIGAEVAGRDGQRLRGEFGHWAFRGRLE